LRLAAGSQIALCNATAAALSFGYKLLLERAEGNWAPDPYVARFPKFEPPKVVVSTTWTDLYELYALEARPEPATQKRQRGVLKALFLFLGHDDPTRVTRDDMIRWKEHCLTLKEPVTVRDADIAHPKALFRWAKTNNKVASDPTENLTVRVPKRKKLRPAEYDDDEAKRVLSWTLVPIEGRTSADRAGAIRWVPWICNYTGARVNEITQMRDFDVYRRFSKDGDVIWMMHITPAAGSVKDGEEREVAIHPHLIEQGFLDYVESRKCRCLFYDPSRARGGSAGNPIYKKVGEFLSNWVRVTVGITDPDVDPNHAWRHRFKSVCLAAKIEPEIIDRLDGHAPRTVGETYGSVWPEVSHERISRLPAIHVKAAHDGTQVPGAKDGVGKRPRLKRAARAEA
jgi:integrase